jgi:hypothetical protein
LPSIWSPRFSVTKSKSNFGWKRSGRQRRDREVPLIVLVLVLEDVRRGTDGTYATYVTNGT